MNPIEHIELNTRMAAKRRMLLNVSALVLSFGALYAWGYQDGEIPRLGFIVSLIGGFSLTNWVAITKADIRILYGSASFRRNNLLIKAMLVVWLSTLILVVVPLSTSGLPEPFRSIYANTYSGWAKPISHVVWFACCWSLPFSALVHRHTRSTNMPGLRYSFRAGVVLATTSFIALWSPLIPIAAWALLRFWRNRRLLAGAEDRRVSR